MGNTLVSKYHGPFSEYEEWHAFAIGVYGGFKDLWDFNGLDKQARQNPDVENNIHYAKGGYVLGALVRIAILIAAGRISVGFL